jgi:hypothetical protein
MSKPSSDDEDSPIDVKDMSYEILLDDSMDETMKGLARVVLRIKDQEDFLNKKDEEMDLLRVAYAKEDLERLIEVLEYELDNNASLTIEDKVLTIRMNENLKKLLESLY